MQDERNEIDSRNYRQRECFFACVRTLIRLTIKIKE